MRASQYQPLKFHLNKINFNIEYNLRTFQATQPIETQIKNALNRIKSKKKNLNRSEIFAFQFYWVHMLFYFCRIWNFVDSSNIDKYLHCLQWVRLTLSSSCICYFYAANCTLIIVMWFRGGNNKSSLKKFKYVLFNPGCD